jgi:hypothetical protein
MWGGVRQWCVVLRWHFFIKEYFFIEGGEGTDWYRALVVISLPEHLPELFWFCFQDVW